MNRPDDTPEQAADEPSMPYRERVTFSAREWVPVLLERYGFVLAASLTLAALGFLLVNDDVLLREPGVASTPMQALSATPDSSSLSRLDVTSSPPGAVVRIDGDSVGTTPLLGYRLRPGAIAVSVRYDGQRQDTVVALRRGSSLLTFVFEGASSTVGEAVTALPPPSIPPDAPTQESIPMQEASEESRETSAPLSPPETALLPEVEEPGGRLVIASRPEGAEVILDGNVVGSTPLEQDGVIAGTHFLQLRHDGYETVARDLDVRAGETTSLNEVLAVAKGTLAVQARPWGTIYIDGTLSKEDTDAFSIELPVGDHRLRVVHPTLGRWEQVVVVVPGEVKTVVVDFEQ